MDDKERELVVVDAPEKWTEATALSKKVELTTPDGEKVLFEIRALSGEQHSAIVTPLVQPEPPMVQNLRGVATPDTTDRNYLLAVAEVKFKRWTAFVNAGWKELPGETLDLKAQWASENLWHRREIEIISDAITALSGFGRGRTGVTSAMPVIVADPKKWAEFSQRPARFIFEREEGEHVYDLAFDLKPISRLVSSQIELNCPDPAVPEIPAPGVGGRIKRFIKNDKDPRYLEQVQAMSDKRVVLCLEASLPWKIPGDDFQAKIQWLHKRPAGEVISLYNHVLGVVNDFQTRSDFL